MCHAQLILGQRQGEAFGDGLLAGGLHVVGELFLSKCHLHGLDASRPLERVVEQQFLFITYGDRHRHELRLVLVAEGM